MNNNLQKSRNSKTFDDLCRLSKNRQTKTISLNHFSVSTLVWWSRYSSDLRDLRPDLRSSIFPSALAFANKWTHCLSEVEGPRRTAAIWPLERRRRSRRNIRRKRRRRDEEVVATVKRGFPRDKIKPALLSAAFRDIGGFSTKRGTEGAWKEACNCPTGIGHAAWNVGLFQRTSTRH